MRFSDCWLLGLITTLALALCGALAVGLSYITAAGIISAIGWLGLKPVPAAVDLLRLCWTVILLPTFIGEAVPSIAGLYVDMRFGKERDARSSPDDPVIVSPGDRRVSDPVEACPGARDQPAPGAPPRW